MTLNNTIKFFENLKSESTKKSEIKVFMKFIYVLTQLKSREFSIDEMQAIEMELDSLNLESNPKNKLSYYKKAYAKFEKHLKNRFSLTPKGYYTNLSIGLGVLFGVVFGILLGERFEKSLGISFGTSMGMLIGAVIGRRMDMRAKEAGNVL